MCILKTIGKSLAAFLFAATSFHASATTYSINESFSGSWEAIWALPIASFTHTSSSHSPISGDPSIFSDSSIQSISVIENVVNCVSCTITETLSNGDKIFFTHLLVDGVQTPSSSNLGTVDNFYNGTVTITGGTGLFTGATGNGIFSAIDLGIYNSDSNGNFLSFNPNGSWQIELAYTVTTPVPEPTSSGLILLGACLIGSITRRNRSTSC